MVSSFQAASGGYTHLVSLAFSGGTTRLTSASTDISWGGNTYTALGGHMTFDAITEGRDLRTQGFNLTLDGVDQTSISSILSNDVIGRACIVHLVKFDSAGAIIADPIILFSGIMNGHWRFKESRAGRNTAKVTMRVLSPFSRFRYRSGIRTSVASHAGVASPDYSGETFFAHLLALNGKLITWGKRTVSAQDPNDPGGSRYDERQDYDYGDRD